MGKRMNLTTYTVNRDTMEAFDKSFATWRVSIQNALSDWNPDDDIEQWAKGMENMMHRLCEKVNGLIRKNSNV